MPPEMVAKLAEIQKDAPVDPTSGFLEKLRADGIDANLAPPAEMSPEAPEPAPEAPEGDQEDGIEDMISAATERPLRDKRIETSEAIKEEALSKGLSEQMAKMLAHSMPRKGAREFLDSYGERVQSEAAGQPAPQPAEAPSAGDPDAAALAEVQEALTASDGEETATAVTRLLSSLVERVQRAEQSASQGAAAAEAQSEASIRQEVMGVAGELSGRFPKLVSDGRIDPAVGRNAALLWSQGDESVRGNWPKAIEAAASLRFGSGIDSAGQQFTTTAHSPDLDAPSASHEAFGGPINRRQQEDIFTEISLRYPNDAAKRVAALKDARKKIDRRNAVAARRQ